MFKLVVLSMLVVLSVAVCHAQTVGAPLPHGLMLSTSPNSGPNKLTTVSTRDIYRRIATKLGAVTTDKRINRELLEEELCNLLGREPIICRLTLKPNGRVEEVSILNGSESIEHDKQAIELLRKIGKYGSCHSSRENLSYQVELPKLYVFSMEPYGNKIYHRPVSLD